MRESPSRMGSKWRHKRLLQSALLIAALASGASAFGPAFVQVPQPLVLFSNTTGIVLDCLARGDPPPTIDWVDENGNPLTLVPSIAR